MSPPWPLAQPSDSLAQAIAVAATTIGLRFAAERRKRRWTLRQVAEKAELSVGVIHDIEAGRTAGLATYVQLARAYGLQLDGLLVDPRQAAADQSDAVHSTMGELEARRIGGHGFPVGLDEPYQHFQFAGRVDFAAWDLVGRALLQIENRTRFPDFQQAAGAWNAKRAYFPAELAKRLGLKYGWRSITNVMAVAWTAEIVDVLRERRGSFRALCPDAPEPFVAWWAGTPPASGTTSSLVVLDPGARRGQEVFVPAARALEVPARHRGYGQLAQRLRSGRRRRGRG